MTAALLRLAPWLALLGVSWFGGCQYQKNRQLSDAVHRLESARAELLARQQVVDTVYRSDTVRLSRLRVRYDTLLVDQRITDTVWVRQFVQAADSTILACTSALETCGARVAYRDSIIANLDSVIRLQKSRGGNWKSKLGWLMAGSAATAIILAR